MKHGSKGEMLEKSIFRMEAKIILKIKKMHNTEYQM